MNDECYDDMLWQRMVKKQGKKKYGAYSIPVELLKKWEEVRLKINPNAKKFDLLRYE